MKKFKFRYESILNMRKNHEDQVKNALAKRIAERQTLLDKLTQNDLESKQYEAHIKKLMDSGEAKAERHSFFEGKQYYIKKKMRLSQALVRMEAELSRIQADLSEAMKQRKIMEKLKEKAFQNYVDAVNELDAKLIEEIVNYKNNQKNGD